MSEAMMENLAQRLERVERENRRLKRGAVAVVGIIVAAVLMGQGGSKNRIIEAEGFQLIDAAGVPRGGLFTFQDGSVGLAISDKDRKAIAMLAVEAKSTVLRLTDKDGNIRVGLGVEPTNGGTGLVFFTPSGKEQAALRTQPDGKAGLYLSDKEGRQRAALSLVPDGFVGLLLQDNEGKAKAISAVTADGTPGFSLYDKNQDVRVALGTSNNGRASISVYPPGGKGPTELFAHSNGLRGLRLWDKEGRQRAVLGLAPDEAVSSLVLFDKDGKAIWAAH